MRPASTLLLRRVLLGVLLLVAVTVVWSLRRSRPAEAPDPEGSEPPEGTTIENLAFDVFREGDRKVELKARAMTGDEGGQQRFQGVEVRFPFVSRGERSTATVTADEGIYEAAREHARFRGNVHVVTADGFELTTESLDYRGDEGRVVTKDDVQFRQGRASGSARGAVYRVAGDVLELRKNVRLRFEDKSGGASTEIDAARAQGSRETRVFNFGGGVKVRKGPRVLRSERLQVMFDADLENLRRAAAIENVDLRIGGSEDLSTASLPGGGERRLQCRRLTAFFNDDGVVENATATNNASLVLWPGPKDPPEKRRMEARRIEFGFDEEGRLARVRARDWGGPGDKGQGIVVLSSAPVAPSKEPERQVECLNFEADLDPVTGALGSAKFNRRVVFTEPGRKAWAERAVYDGQSQLLQMTEGAPRIRDEVDGSELQAQRIELATATRSVVAVDGVRHAIRGGTADGEGGMLGGSEPTVLVCQKFEYDSAQKKAWYRENALLRAGRDEVRAPLIVMEDPAPGARRLTASGGVASFLYPRSRPGEQGEKAVEPSPVETHSAEMVYEEEASRVVYSGDVQIRQGDILTLSPRAVVTLTEGGDDVQRIVAGEPVEVRQGPRQAKGQTGTYTPADETMVLEGEEVVLQDVDRLVRGRVLTFKVGEDRIRVDGQEEVRTEAIFKRREPAKP
jgi:LPS export ABC transporter protein LptC/lipopolysaccharide transport protein LptA